jgi:hypothetical protein
MTRTGPCREWVVCTRVSDKAGASGGGGVVLILVVRVFTFVLIFFPTEFIETNQNPTAS